MASLSATQETLGIRLAWAHISDLDRASYQLRSGGSAWGVGDTPLATVSATSFLWAIQTSGSLVVRIKAVDTSGNLSTNATSTTVVIAGPSAPGAPATGTAYTVVGVNETVTNIVNPLNVTAKYVDDISKGVIPPVITTDYKGQYNVIKGNLNNMVKMMSELLAQTDIIIQAAADGELKPYAYGDRPCAYYLGAKKGSATAAANDIINVVVLHAPLDTGV